MNKKYFVDLEEEESRTLKQITRSGKHSARKIRWAHALLKADAGWKDEKIAEALDISLPTVQRIRQRFVEEAGGSPWRTQSQVEAKKRGGWVPPQHPAR